MTVVAITNQINAIITSVLSSPDKSVPRPPMPIPDTLKGVDDLIRAGFEAYRSSCFNWLLAATGLVVVGLVFEGPELWHDITTIVRQWRFKRSFHFSLPESHAPNWAKLAAFVGWLFIVVGVAGEYVADSFVSKADGYVQTFDEILLTQAQRGAVVAKERATAAYERASENERETANTLKQVEQERADAAKSLAAAETARKEAKGFSLRIAQANERAATAERDAAQANRIAEQERLARIRIEDTLSGWKLDGTAQAHILEKITSFPGTPFDLAVNPSEYGFMEIMDGILGSAKWARQTPKADNPLFMLLIDGKASMWLGSGVHIEFTLAKYKEFGAPADALLKALQAEGIPAEEHAVKEGAEPNAIHIVIGKRE
jgi:hypothetical protein